MKQNHVTGQKWDLIIKPKTGWFDLRLAELWHYRELVGMLVRRDFVTVYKQTILGPLWFLLQPLLTTTVFTVIFGKIAKISTGEIPHYLFYLSGLSFWVLFSESVTTTANTFVGNAAIFGKVYFPRIVVPISTVISNLFKLAIQLLLLTTFYVYFANSGMTFRPTIHLILLPVLIVQTCLLSLGLGLLISSLTTKYRDLSMLVGFGINLMMYATPIVYDISQVPPGFLTLYRLNPMVGIISNFRHGVFGTGTPEPMIMGWCVTILILALGIISFSRVEKTFMDTV